MGTTETVSLSVEVEEKFRVRPHADLNHDSPRYTNSTVTLFDWVDTYVEANDNGIEMLARFDQVLGFSIEKQTRRVVPVVN